jgi:hypothetical protein
MIRHTPKNVSPRIIYPRCEWEDVNSVSRSGGTIFRPDGQFHMPEWSEDYRINVRCEAWTHLAPRLLSIFKSLRLLTLWNVEGRWRIDHSKRSKKFWRPLDCDRMHWHSNSSSPSSSIMYIAGGNPCGILKNTQCRLSCSYSGLSGLLKYRSRGLDWSKRFCDFARERASIILWPLRWTLSTPMDGFIWWRRSPLIHAKHSAAEQTLDSAKYCTR